MLSGVSSYILFGVLTTCTVSVFSLRHLTPNQWSQIRRIITNPNTPVDIIQKTHNVVYTHYEKWALRRVDIFHEKYAGLCRRITKPELAIYAASGLMKAVERYNYGGYDATTAPFATAPFAVYAAKWIDYTLLDGMTELQPLTVLPKRFRKRKGVERTHFQVDHMSKRNHHAPKYIHPYESYDMNIIAEYENAWDKLSTELTNPFAQRAFRLKFSTTFDEMRSTKEVAELMACSEETVRRKLWGHFQERRKYE